VSAGFHTKVQHILLSVFPAFTLTCHGQGSITQDSAAHGVFKLFLRYSILSVLQNKATGWYLNESRFFDELLRNFGVSL